MSRIKLLLVVLLTLIPPSGCASLQATNDPASFARERLSAVNQAQEARDLIKADVPQIDDSGRDIEPDEAAALPDNGNGSNALSESEQIVQGTLDAALEMTEEAQDLWSTGDADKALEALDNAYLLIAKVTPDSGPKLIQQKEDLRFMIAKRITEIHASRITTVNGTHKEIPMVMNDHVQREIQSFQGQEREFFLESYRRSGLYREDMAKALKEAGLPEEISWLPLIESGFKAKALSRSRALGLWQFIPSTGYKFGLKRNTWIDERLNPRKATNAAIAYLKELHSIFGDWATALAAYNCGEGNVLRAIRDQKINYLDNFWDLYERLPRETARYYPRFLAVLHIIKEPEKYGFRLDEIDTPPACETVTIEKQLHLKTIAKQIGIEKKELALLNPEIRREATPPKAYDLRVPADKVEILLANIESMPVYKPPKVSYVYHRVRRGESLSLIALRYRTSVRRIVKANRLRSRSFIRVGQRLKIPVRGST